MTRGAAFPPRGAIRAVLFDAGNTLLWIDHARIAEILGVAGVSCDERAVREAEMRARPRLDPYLGRAPKRESPQVFRRYVDLVLEGLGVVDERRAAPARAAVEAAWGTLWVRAPEDARPTLDALHARGYRLGVVSNSNGKARRLLEAAGLAGRLDCVVDSGDVGVEKPDPRIFRIAAEQLDTAPPACLYVGDFLSLDVHGARAAGMHAALLDPLDVWVDADAPRLRSLTELLEHLPGV